MKDASYDCFPNVVYVLVCASSPVVNFATPSFSGPFNTGESVTYTCDSGYRLSGSAILICQENGFFSPAAPTCNKRKISSQ